MGIGGTSFTLLLTAAASAVVIILFVLLGWLSKREGYAAAAILQAINCVFTIVFIGVGFLAGVTALGAATAANSWWRHRNDDDDDDTTRRRRRVGSKLKSLLPKPKAFDRSVPALDS